MTKTETEAKPCPNCGHCPTCGHTPRPVWVAPPGWICAACGVWTTGVHSCRPYYGGWWQIPWTATGDSTVQANTTDYVLTISAGVE